MLEIKSIGQKKCFKRVSIVLLDYCVYVHVNTIKAGFCFAYNYQLAPMVMFVT
jgi:hypothetical protein